MKKIIFLVLVITSVTACQKIKNLANISFSIPYSQTITVPTVPGYTYGMPIPGGSVQLPFPPVTVAINAQQYFNQYHASAKNVVSASLGSMSLQITTPETQYFDFLNTIQLSVSTEIQPVVLVAYLYDVPKGQKTINLIITPGVDLKDYVTGDSITVQLNAYVNAVPAPGTQIYLSGNFNVTANPLD